MIPTDPAKYNLIWNNDLKNMIPVIRKYCLKITGNALSAEDLTQDVIIKIVTFQRKNPLREVTRSFLYRTALNTWLDQLKKQTVETFPIESHPSIDKHNDENFVTRELLEDLAYRLSARDMVILLLMDVFRFTAQETAQLLDHTPAALQVALGRARKRLKNIASQIQHSGKSPQELTNYKPKTLITRQDFDALVDAFRDRNIRAIRDCYLKLSKNGTRVESIRIDGTRRVFHFYDPDGNMIQVVS